MAWEQEARTALGQRLASARTLAGFTLEAVAKEFTTLGRPMKKQTVSSWEKGRNVPDSLVLRRLSKLYAVTTDALLWDDSLTIEAIRFAAQFDALDDKLQRAFRAMWLAYFEQAVGDDDVQAAFEAKNPDGERIRGKRSTSS